MGVSAPRLARIPAPPKLFLNDSNTHGGCQARVADADDFSRDHRSRRTKEKGGLCGMALSLESGCLKVQPKAGGKLHLRLNMTTRPIANKYREGKLKQDSVERVKESVKPSRGKRMESRRSNRGDSTRPVLGGRRWAHMRPLCLLGLLGARPDALPGTDG